MVKDYLLDEMLSGNENVCKNLMKQGKKIHKLPKNLHGQPDENVINYAKQKGYKLITKDLGCANIAQKHKLSILLIQN